jgi:sugar phosphate permease
MTSATSASDPNTDPGNEWTGGDFRRTWRWVTTAGSLGVTYLLICATLTSAPRVKFLSELGATAFDFGLIAAVTSLALGLQVIAGVMDAYLSRRKRVWIALTLAHRLMFVFVLAAPSLFTDGDLRIAWIVMALALHEGLANLGAPLWFSWMADLLPRQTLGRHWAHRQWMVTLVSTVLSAAMALLFYVFERRDEAVLGFVVIGSVCLAMGVVDVLMFVRVPEPPIERADRGNPAAALLQPLRDREFRPFLVFRAWFQFAAALAYPFFAVYMIEQMRVSALTTQLLFLMTPLGVVASSRMWGLLCDTFGERPVMIVILGGKIMVPLVFIAAPPIPAIAIPLMAPLLFIDGAFNAAFDLSNQGIILRTTPRRNRTMYIAANNFFSVGAAAALAPLLSGWTIDALAGQTWDVGVYRLSGFHAVFAASSLLRAIAILFAVRLPRSGSAPVPTLLRSMLSPTTLRAARYTIVLGESPDPARRVKVARRLGRLANPLAVRELAVALKDPSLAVRQAAATALGRIGQTEASASLALAIGDPITGIQREAVRALGRIGGPDSLKALLAGLRQLGPEALGDAADALARIGDPAALLPLVCLLGETPRGAMREKLIAALARLGKTTENDVISTLFGEAGSPGQSSV